MKTKTLLLLGLFLGFGVAQLSAQSYSFNVSYSWWLPVYCDGVEVDYLDGDVTAHLVYHIDPTTGDFVFSHWTVRGEATSTYTGETFDIKENDKVYSNGINTWHYNVSGDQGSHYIGSMSWDKINDPNFENPVIVHSVCPGNQ